MREIKFRAWDVVTKEMHTNPFNGYIGGINDKFEDTGNWIHMQFVGLSDKTGKEVYEGDIVNYGEYNKIATVEWNAPMACFWPCVSVGSNLTIIGNIYENPNLISENN